jgi:SprT protein
MDNSGRMNIMVNMMTRTELLEEVNHCADGWWIMLRKLYPSISSVRPEIVLNNRLKTTAGRAFYANDPQYVDLSMELLTYNLSAFLGDTIPHELCHLVAWTVYNEHGHGNAWKMIMRSIGLEPTRLHNMINPKHEVRRMK